MNFIKLSTRWRDSLNRIAVARMQKVRNLALVFIVLILCPALTATIEDGAKLFSPRAVTLAEKKLTQVREKTKKEILIKTVEDLGQKKMPHYLSGEAISRKINGAIILITVKERQFEIASGRQTGLIFTPEHKAKLKELIHKNLRNAKDKTLGEVVDYLHKLFTEAPEILLVEDSYELPVAASSVPETNSRNAILAAVMGLFMVGLIVVFKNR